MFLSTNIGVTACFRRRLVKGKQVKNLRNTRCCKFCKTSVIYLVTGLYGQQERAFGRYVSVPKGNARAER